MGVAGVDGCRGVAMAASLTLVGGRASLTRGLPLFRALLEALGGAEAVAGGHAHRLVRGRRLADRAHAIWLPASDWANAPAQYSSLQLAPSLKGQPYADLRPMGLSVQAYHLIPRIREIDALITPQLQRRVWESHPELSFMAMNGAPVALPKRTEAGQQARYALLQQALPLLCPDWWEAVQEAFGVSQPRKLARIDDLLDACALAWSAWRHMQGQSEACIGEPAHDARGLEMAISLLNAQAYPGASSLCWRWGAQSRDAQKL